MQTASCGSTITACLCWHRTYRASSPWLTCTTMCRPERGASPPCSKRRPVRRCAPSTPRTITTLLQMLCPRAASDSLRRARAHRGARFILDVCLLLSAALPSLGTSLDPLDRRAVTMAHPERRVLLSVPPLAHRLPPSAP